MPNQQNRRDYQVQSTQAVILDAAARVFLRHGYQRATMRGIAEEAGFAASALYKYFKSKEALFRGLRERLESQGLEAFQRALPGGLTFPQKLEVVMLRLAETAFGTREVILLCVVASVQLPDETLDQRLERSRAFNNQVARWIEHAATKEELNGHDPNEIAYVLTALIEGKLRQTAGSGEITRARLNHAMTQVANYLVVIMMQPFQPCYQPEISELNRA